jgi:hypothetical protein
LIGDGKPADTDAPKRANFKKIFGWIIFYLIVINLTSALQGVLGGLALAYNEGYYLSAKFAGALVVYTAAVFFLTRKHTFLATFKILSIFYLIAALGRIAGLFMHIPDDSGRRFRRKPATHSD